MFEDEISVIQLNLNKSYNAGIDLLGKINKKKSFLALVQEPYCYKGSLAAIPGRADYVPSARTGGPRAAIFADKRLKLREVTHLCTRDLAAGVCVIGNKQTLVISAYQDINHSVRSEALTKLLDYRSEKRLGLLLATDSNAHCTLWGHSNNPRGTAMAELITEYGLLLRNIGKEYTYDCQLGKSVIDLTLTCNLGAGIQNWKVNKSLNFSDHNTITYTMATDILELPPTRPWAKADWTLFEAELAEHDWPIGDFITEKNLNHMVDRLTRVLTSALDKACPLSKACSINKNNPWFTPQLKQLRVEVGAAYERKKANNSEQNLAVYKDRLKRYKRLIHKTKNNYHVKYVDSIQNEEEMSHFVKGLLKQKTAAKPSSLKRADGTFTQTPKEAILELASTHFPSHKPIPVCSYNREKFDITEIKDSFVTWISARKIKEVLMQFKSKKAAGPDGLKPIIFGHMPDKYFDILEIIYKSIIFTSFTPRKWREAKVIFIPKPGKAIYQIAKDFRPISLTNHALKGLEKLVVQCVDQTLESMPISEQQQGFRRCRSTETAISNTVNYIEKFNNRDDHCLAVFLDIAAAFDTISPKHIKDKLLEKEVNGKLVDWYYSYITERHLALEANDFEIRTCVNVGFPQGGVCSAKFWIIAFDPAIKIINENGIFGQGFADDCAALIGGTDLTEITHKMNRALDKLVSWGETCGLKFNSKKTVLLHYKNSTKRKQTHPEIKMSGQPILPSRHTRYLGVEIDDELSWNHHITTKIDKCRNLIAIISANVRHTFGPKPKLVKWAYTGVIRPKLLYACQAWAHKVTKKHTKSMKRLDRLTTTAMAPIRRSTPQATLEIMFDLTPIELLIEQLGAASFLRTQAHLEHYTDRPNGHLSKWAEKIDKLQIHGEVDTIENTTTLNRPYNVNITSLTNDTNKFIKHSEYTAYTDGSKIEGRTGAGVIIYKHKEIIYKQSYSLPTRASIFQAELEAIRQAALFFNKQRTRYPAKYIKLLVDSQAALKSLCHNSVRSETVRRTMQELSNLGSEIPRLTLAWIKAHVGHEGNELADLAAKQGALEPQMSIKVEIPLSKTEIDNTLKSLIYNKWQLRWTSSPDYKHSKLFLNKPDTTRAKKILQLPRLKTKRLVEIITGHNNLSYFQFKVDPDVNPLCRFCEEQNETFHHLVTDCPRLRQFRTDNIKPFDGNSWSVAELLNFSYIPEINDYLERKDYLVYGNLQILDHNYSSDDSS